FRHWYRAAVLLVTGDAACCSTKPPKSTIHARTIWTDESAFRQRIICRGRSTALRIAVELWNSARSRERLDSRSQLRWIGRCAPAAEPQLQSRALRGGNRDREAKHAGFHAKPAALSVDREF